MCINRLIKQLTKRKKLIEKRDGCEITSKEVQKDIDELEEEIEGLYPIKF